MADFSEDGLIFFVFDIIFTTLCGLFVAIRLIAAKIANRGFYLDDGFIIFSYVSITPAG